MFDPDRIVFHRRWMIITRHEKTDRNGPAPWREVLNLRRYSFTFWPGTPRHKKVHLGPYRGISF